MSSESSCVAPSTSDRSDRLVGVEDLETWLSVKLRSISEMSESAFSRKGELDINEATADDALAIVMVEEGDTEEGVEVEEDITADPRELLFSLLPFVKSMGWSLLMW